MDSLDRLGDLTGKTSGEILRDRAGSLGRYLAEATQPVAGMDTANPDGGSAAAKNLGRAAVARDIRKVYISPASIFAELKNKPTFGPSAQNYNAGTVLARRFYKLLKSGDLAGAKAIMRAAGVKSSHLELILWDGGAIHRRSRNKRGRIGRGFSPYVVSDAKAVKKYTADRQKNVGFAKSGWVHAAEEISGKKHGGTAAWIKAVHGPGKGRDMTGDLRNPRISLTNQVRYISAILDEKYELRAMGAFERSLQKEIAVKLEHLAKKEATLANRAGGNQQRRAA